MRYSLESRILTLQLYLRSGSYPRFVEEWRAHSDEKPPSRQTVRRCLNKFNGRGELKDKHRSGRKRVRDDNMIATVGAFFSINNDASINTFIDEFGNIISRSTIWRILRNDLQWKPYRPRRVHRLLPGDDVKRFWCLDKLLKMQNDDPTFIVKIIWSDECIFKLNGSIATNNVVHWADKNPHFTYQKSTNRSGIMVFAAISVVGVISIAFFDETRANQNKKKRNSVTKASYTEVIEEKFIPDLANIYPDIDEREQLYFMQDGASSHRIPVILNQHFGNKWLGNSKHDAPIFWPSRSPDLTPMGM